MATLEDMRGFWQGRRVVVTGHTGFKGSWLCLWLGLLEAEVAGYALDPPTEPSLFELADVGRDIASVQGDVRDLEHLARTIEDFAPQIVIHMAAQSLVRESYRDAVGTYGTNVMGTVHVFESARRAGSVRAILNVTSDKCYANPTPPERPCHAHPETDPMGGDDPYSSSKGCAELATSAWRRSFFTDGTVLASVRAGNVIGGGDWAADRLVPDCIRAMAEGRPVVIRNPQAVRPWQHVLEPLGGYLLLAERLLADGEAYAEAWNFGPDAADALPVSALVDRVVALWGQGASWVHDEADHPPEAQTLRLDCGKAAGRLGWRPRTDIDTALRWTVDWYRRVRDGDDPRQLTLDRIRAFSDISTEAGDDA